MTGNEAAPSSFRDDAGFVFFKDGQPYRHVNKTYRADLELLKSSGLLRELQDEALFITHEEITVDQAEYPHAVAILKPERVAMVSYPYEWSLGQLRAAALCTLEIQRRAIGKGMSLKDASAYNIQFVRGAPTLIDTLSLEKYIEGEPWIAYKQFCQHFLAPLALMANVAPEMSNLLRANIDGIPLVLASRLLPWRTKFNLGLLLHIHAHAGSHKKYGTEPKRAGRVSKTGMLGLIDSLNRTITAIHWRQQTTAWSNYYANTNYSSDAMNSKHKIVHSALEAARPRVVWDIGANTGEFSRIAAEMADSVVAWDLDPVVVDRHYETVRKNGVKNVLPLVGDLTNPSPALGWANVERDSFLQRADCDLVMALALVHHLAIGNNVPLSEIARFFASIGPKLIVEFVPKGDSQVDRMLATRKDIFPNYTQAGFESAFSEHFKIIDSWIVSGSQRSIYSMERLSV